MLLHPAHFLVTDFVFLAGVDLSEETSAAPALKSSDQKELKNGE